MLLHTRAIMFAGLSALIMSGSAFAEETTGFTSTGADMPFSPGGVQVMDLNTNGTVSITGVIDLSGGKTALNGLDVDMINQLAALQACTQNQALTKTSTNPNTYACIAVSPPLPACPQGDALISQGVDSSGQSLGYSCQTVPVDGACGPSNGGTFSSAPTSGLCNSGTASAVSGSGPWSWTCTGVNDGVQASCQAQPQQKTFNLALNCNGNFCNGDQATANEVCVQEGMNTALSFITYPITTSNPFNGAFTGNQCNFITGSWRCYWAGQCNTGGGCTPGNGNGDFELDQVTCQ